MAALFGAELRKCFHLEEDTTFINHGSFGTVPRSVYEARLELMLEMERNPDLWFRKTFSTHVIEGMKVVAELINCPPGDAVFVENATVGVTTALRSLDLKPEDGLLVSCLTYQSIWATADRVCNTETIFKHHVINLDPPYKDKGEAVERYRSYLSSHPDVKVAVVDHITSPSTLLLPVKEIVEVCHQFGVKVIVDGAHAPGHVNIDVTDIGAEYYTGNLHKWYFCPRGCAFLHVRPDQKSIIRPLLASSLYPRGFPYEFLIQGTRDNTSMAVVPQAKEFFQSLGGLEGIHGYCIPLLEWAVDMISEKTGEPRLSVPKDMSPPLMGVVRFPESLQGDRTRDYGAIVMSILAKEYGVVVAVDVIAGELWIRMCCGVYNVKEDYEKLAQALSDLKEHPEKLSSNMSVIEEMKKQYCFQ